jgi:adenylate/guanylate cyclase family protein
MAGLSTSSPVMGSWAPITLEKHAFRACLAALDIQQAARRLAVEVGRRDGIDLRLRVGLNSGQVIAGEVGATHLGYTAVGEHVGMAQRMEATESLRLAQRVIDIADGDPTMGALVIGSPLAWAIAVKGAAGMFLGWRGWRDDLNEGVALAQSFDVTTRPLAQLYKYAAAVQNSAVLPDTHDVAQAEDTLEIAQRSGNNTAVAYALLNRATTLIHNDSETVGFDFLTRARQMIVDEQLTVALRRMADIEIARERARAGDLGGAIDLATTVLVDSSTPER